MANKINAAAEAYEGYPPEFPYNMSYTYPTIVFMPAAFKFVPKIATSSLYALNAPINQVMTKYEIIGMIIGNVIFVNVLKELVPSTLAALYRF